MEGGRILGSPGSYGCAFTPPLLCQSGKIPYGKKRKVGKITGKKDAEREIKTANRLRLFPLASLYFLLPDPDSCVPAEPSKQTEKDLKLCLNSDFAKRTPLSSLRQIFSPLGGPNLFSSLHSSNLHPSRFHFFDFMRHMLEIGSSLAISGVVHFDLHPGNILLDKQKVPRVIDFGRSFFSNEIHDEVVEERNYGLLFLRDDLEDVIINQQPPEMDILNAIKTGYPISTAVKQTVLHIPALSTAQGILRLPLRQSIKEAQDFCQTSRVVQEKDMVKMWSLYWPKFDAWSIGTLLLYILKQQMLFKEFEELWNQRKEATIATLRGLLHTNPRMRFDCVKALSLYDPDNVWLNQFGGPWLSSS